MFWLLHEPPLSTPGLTPIIRIQNLNPQTHTSFVAKGTRHGRGTQARKATTLLGMQCTLPCEWFLCLHFLLSYLVLLMMCENGEGRRGERRRGGVGRRGR